MQAYKQVVYNAMKSSLSQWHSRLGHPSFSTISQIVNKNGLLIISDTTHLSICDVCQQGKSHQLPYPNSLSISNVPLELVFSDIWGPAPESVSKKKYYVSFIDDYSKFTWVYLIKFKSEVLEKFQEFQSLVECLFNRKIISIQTDWRGEYKGLDSFFSKIGITHLVSCPHGHQQNEAAERKHRHIVEVGLSLLAHASMPLKFWDEAIISAAYLINRLPSKVIQHQTTLDRLFHQTPNYSLLRVFGCACWSNLRPYNTHKLTFRSKQCVFLEYNTLYKGYKCMDTSTGRVYVSRDVVFDEKLFPFATMNKDAGARLRSEITCLHPSLLNHGYGAKLVDDQCANYPKEIANDLVQDVTQEGTRNRVEQGVEHKEDALDRNSAG
jgi:hypothetical protein